MDRDAALRPTSPADAVPPVAAETVRTTGLFGIGLLGTAALIGLAGWAAGELPSVLNTARLFLVLIGLITAGSAISMRHDLWWSWALGAAGALLAWGGLPSHWDSYRLVCWALFGVALAGMALCLLPTFWRYVVGTAVIVFHFTGIFMATTSPPTDPSPAPWITLQAFARIYDPYLQFIYQRNAYHFYSPNPGPASVLAFLLKTETGTDTETGAKQYKYEWIVIPRRPAHVRDPLGLTYYRRLSLSAQLEHGTSLAQMPANFEQLDVTRRRKEMRMVYPMHPLEPEWFQYRLPIPTVTRFLLPSYASHVLLQNTPDKEAAAKTTVKIYRLEHRTMPAEQFGIKLPNGKYQDPYHPGTYRPYFLGEYDAYGTLINPQEEMLYWLVPIIPRTPAPNDPDDPFKKDYLDYLSVHALGMQLKDVLKADETKGQVFDWSQLR